MDGDEDRLVKLREVFPVNFLGVIIFYLNSELLARVFLQKGRIATYFISLAILFVVYLVCYVYLKDYIIDRYPIRMYDSRTLFPVLFITGMSTLYSLVVHMLTTEKRNQEANAERMVSELSFLRSQISPHFIFNVLNSIVYLIRTKSENAEKVTIELSKLIRYMLYESDNKQVFLDREVEYLENYIGLQKVRFGEDVDISIELEGNYSGLLIEPMLLIPFVENAFKHGVGYIKDPFINVNLSVSEDNRMVFCIKNKMATNPDEEKDKNSGIGIKNVKRRIELLYPETHELTLGANDGIFEVYLKLFLKNTEK